MKGKKSATKIIEIFDHDPEELRDQKQEHQLLFQQAFAVYQEGLWHDAQRLFEQYSQHVPLDTLPKVFIDRCRQFTKLPPTNWNGIFRIENK